MIVKLLTRHHLEVFSLKGGCRGSSESTHVKMPHCWKSYALAKIVHRSLQCKFMYSLRAAQKRLTPLSSLSLLQKLIDNLT